MSRRPNPRRASTLVAFALMGVAACSDGGSVLTAGNDPTSTPAPAGSPAPGDTTTTVARTTTTVALSDLPPCPVAALDTVTTPVEITFWHGMNGVNETAINTLTAAYNASQDKVRVNAQNQGGYEQTITKYLQSSSGGRPDLVQMPDYMVQGMKDTDSVIPVEACVEAAGYDLSNFVDRAIRAYSTEGVMWAMPFNVSDPVLYYNKKIFAAAGLDPEQPPTSLEQLRSFSEQIVSSGAAATGIALDTGSDSGGGWFLEQWLANAGELYADNGNGRSAPATKVVFNGPTGVELLTFLQTLLNDGLAVNVGDNASSQDNFLRMAAADPAAMTIGTSAALGQVIDVLGSGLIPGLTTADIGVGPMPGPGATPSALVGGASLWIVDGRGDPKTAAAWDFITYLDSADVQSRWSADTGYVPVRSDALEVEPIKSVYTNDPRFRVAYDQLLAAGDVASAVGPMIGPLREIRSVVAQAVAQIFAGTDVATALDQAASQANALIADYAARTN